MTTTNPTPASMGEPLSEADRLADVREALADWMDNDDCDALLSCDTALLTLLDELEAARARVGVLEGQLATARELHKPERRYTPDDGETSYATYAEAADASFDGTGRPAMVTFFEVCSHCASIEMAEGCDHQYKESLWPCKEAIALGLDGGDPGA